MSIAALEELRDEMKKCFRCSLCKLVPLPTVQHPKFSDGCPAVHERHFHGYSGSGKQIMALSLIDGRIAADSDLAGITFYCTACGLCDVSCKFIMEAERHRVNMALKEHIVEAGLGPEVHRRMVEKLARDGSAEGVLLTRPGDWAGGLGLKLLPRERSDTLLYAGRAQCEDPSYAATVRKMAILLKKAGVDFGILGNEEPESGLFAYWTGHRDAFVSLSEKAVSRFDDCDVKTIIAVSGSHLGMLRSKYPEYARSPRAEIVHATEFLARLVRAKKLRLTKPVETTITYHDPCYLGRQSEPPIRWEGEHKMTHGCMTYTDPPKEINYGVNGVFEAPRQLLAAIPGITFREMYRVREYSWCCGGGGGAPAAFPDLASSAARHRVEEARDVGAQVMVTACHACRRNLHHSQERLYRMPVVDIIDLVYDSADIRPGDMP